MAAGLLAGAAESAGVALSEGVGTGAVTGALWKSSKSSTENAISHARRKVQQDSQSFDAAGLDTVAVGAATAGAGAEVEGPQESSSKSSRFWTFGSFEAFGSDFAAGWVVVVVVVVVVRLDPDPPAG